MSLLTVFKNIIGVLKKWNIAVLPKPRDRFYPKALRKYFWRRFTPDVIYYTDDSK